MSVVEQAIRAAEVLPGVSKITHADAPWHSLGEGKRFQPMVAEDLGIALVEFEPGVSQAAHAHVDTQIVLCLSGVIELAFGEDGADQRVVVRAGETVSIRPNIRHGLRSLEKSKILTIWSPMSRFHDIAIQLT